MMLSVGARPSTRVHSRVQGEELLSRLARARQAVARSSQLAQHALVDVAVPAQLLRPLGLAFDSCALRNFADGLLDVGIEVLILVVAPLACCDLRPGHALPTVLP